MTQTVLPLRHLLLALAVVAVWGTNFVIIRIGLGQMPSLLFAALRFVFACLPGVFFFQRPRVPWSSLAAYGLLIGTGQFGLLYVAMRSDISPGLASLVIQMQVFFTIGLALAIAKERLRVYQLLALLLGASGIVVIALNTDAATTPLGLILVLIAAFSWGCGNIVAKQAGISDMLPFVIWASLFSAPPLIALSFVFEGWGAIRNGLVSADSATWSAVLWQSLGNTLFGYAAWGFLLSRYPAAVITPTALLVPVFGMAASAFYFGEALPAWKLAAAGFVLAGLAVGLLAPRWLARRQRLAA